MVLPLGARYTEPAFDVPHLDEALALGGTVRVVLPSSANLRQRRAFIAYAQTLRAHLGYNTVALDLRPADGSAAVTLGRHAAPRALLNGLVSKLVR